LNAGSRTDKARTACQPCRKLARTKGTSGKNAPGIGFGLGLGLGYGLGYPYYYAGYWLHPPAPDLDRLRLADRAGESMPVHGGYGYY
jgi:hypothetical protein